MRVIAVIRTSILLQCFFLYFFLSGTLTTIEPKKAAVSCFLIAGVSFLLSLYGGFQQRKTRLLSFLTIVTLLFAVFIAFSTIFVFYLPEAGMDPLVQ